MLADKRSILESCIDSSTSKEGIVAYLDWQAYKAHFKRTKIPGSRKCSDRGKAFDAG
jgi:hypothetical protein